MVNHTIELSNDLMPNYLPFLALGSSTTGRGVQETTVVVHESTN